MHQALYKVSEPFLLLYNWDNICYTYIFFLVVIILGMAHHSFWYCLLLFYFILTQRTLNKVIDSIWGPRWAIFWTFCLLIGLIYIFSLFYWGIFFTDLNLDNCHNYFPCIFSFIDQTFKEKPVWDVLLHDYMDDTPFRYGRFFVDAIFLVSVIKIVGEMFTGIITDRFGNLREKLADIEEDQNENCFICGKGIEEIEKEG